MDYDLNDEAGEQTNVELTTGNTTTLAKTVPVINITDLTITNDEVTFTFDLDDIHDVLSSGTVKAGLYYNDVLQAEKLLFTNEISFGLSGFLANYDFEIIISGNYDLDDGAGLVTDGEIEVLEYTTNAYSAPTAQIVSLVINQNTVDLVINITDSDNTITNNSIAVLYDKDDVILETIYDLVEGSNTIVFSETLTYRELYSVVVYSDYNLRDGEGEKSDVPLAENLTSVYNKLIPQALISNVIIGEDTITLDVDVYDNDAVIALGTIKALLYLDGVYIAELDLASGPNGGLLFDTLLSNREYEIRIETEYDNDNGNGAVLGYLMTTSLETTNAKTDPTASILLDSVFATEIIVDIVFDDDSTVTSSRVAKLYDDEHTLLETQVLVIGDNLNVTFSGLLGNTTYTIEVESDYDMSDGEGVITSVLDDFTQVTPDSGVPTAKIVGVEVTSSKITVEYNFVDNDSVSQEQYAVLYVDDVFVAELALSEGENLFVTFTGLAPNKTYVVKIESSYDLNDLNGLQSDIELFESEATTESIILINPDFEVVGKKRNQLEIEIDDYESILTGAYITATLIQDGVRVDTYIIYAEHINTIDLINLLSIYDYTLEFEATYNSGGGNVTEVIYIHEFTTEVLERPTVEINPAELWSNAGGNLTINVDFGEDADSIAIDDTWNALLYQDGILVDTVDLGTINDTGGVIIPVVFIGFDHTDGSIYTIVIEAEVELNEEPGVGYVVMGIVSRTFADAGN